MIIHKTMDSGWLSNTWLVADEPGGHAVVIDTGGPMQPILKHIEEYRLEISHVLCTHHHHDHVVDSTGLWDFLAPRAACQARGDQACGPSLEDFATGRAATHGVPSERPGRPGPGERSSNRRTG